MVVRLGLTASTAPQHYEPTYRFIQGQLLHLHLNSDAIVVLRAWARVIYDDGSDALLNIADVSTSSDRNPEDIPGEDVATQDGWVVGAVVETLTSGINRGQTYVRLQMEPFGVILLADYVYSNAPVALGTHVSAGPAGGAGYLHMVTVAAVGVPALTTAFAPVLSNKIRKVIAYSWPYVCDGTVETRTLAVYLEDFLGEFPAGHTARDTFESVLVLTADEDGNFFADPDRSGVNDNGTLTIVADTPLPLWVSDDQDGTQKILFSAFNFQAGDSDAIYVLLEEWILP